MEIRQNGMASRNLSGGFRYQPDAERKIAEGLAERISLSLCGVCASVYTASLICVAELEVNLLRQTLMRLGRRMNDIPE